MPQTHDLILPVMRLALLAPRMLVRWLRRQLRRGRRKRPRGESIPRPDGPPVAPEERLHLRDGWKMRRVGYGCWPFWLIWLIWRDTPTGRNGIVTGPSPIVGPARRLGHLWARHPN